MKKFLFVLFAALILFAGCDNDAISDKDTDGGVVEEGKKTQGDLTLLKIKKAEAESLKEGVVIATNAEEVAQGRMWVTNDEMFSFDEAISAASSKINAALYGHDWVDTSQSAVDNTVTVLSEAITAFIKDKKDGHKSSGFTKEELLKLIEDAEAAKKGVQTSSDGANINPKDSWVLPVVMDELNYAIDRANGAAYNPSSWSADPIDIAYLRLVIAIRDFYMAKQYEFRHTISITDMDSFYHLQSNNLDIMIGLFPTADIYEDTEPLCFGYNYNIYNDSVTVYLINKSDYNLWLGNGQYYVGLLLNTNNGNSFYRSNTKVTFSNSNSKQTISFSEFTQVSNHNNSNFNPTNVTTLTANTWADGNIPSLNSEQWFKFTATDSIQYIHVNFGTMRNMNVQLYDSNGNTLSYISLLHSDNYTTCPSAIIGQEYYIKVTPYRSYFNDSSYGTYQIAFNSSSTAASILTILPSNAVTLTPNNWVDGNIPTPSGEQWFKFTATASTQYIHAIFGTLENLYVQLYDNSGISVGSQTMLYNSAKNTSWSLTGGQYYIKVSSCSSSKSGTYRIALNTSATAPIPANAVALIPNIWNDGNLISASNEQWFKFTASADKHYIHVNFDTLKDIYVQLYDKNGNTFGSGSSLSGNNKYTLQSSLNTEQEYYIQVTSNNSSNSSGGTYRITFNTFLSAPIPLTAGAWTNGNITTSSGEQWFYFTATNNTQYIHTGFGTLDSYSGLNVQLYDSKGDAVGIRTRLYNSVKNTSRSLTKEQEYYIKVTPYNSSDSGGYRIAFNASATAPSTALPSNAIALTLNFWVDGNIPTSSGEQWFKFTATADTHYIHAYFGAISSLTVQLYDNSGDSTVGSGSVLNSNNKYISRPSLTIGQVYYIKVTPYSGSGAYQIVFNTSSTAPIVPIWLNSGLWFDGNIPTSNDEQWFKFTATADTQYIHTNFGTLSNLNVQLYNSSGSAVGETTTLSNSTKYISRSSLTIGQVYYIKVTPSSGSGAYQIAFNASLTAPPVVIQLVAGLWTDSNIPASNGEQWFKFTATADTQYIHANFGTLSNLNVQLYNNSGYSVGDKAVLSNNTKNISRSLTIGQVYYIKVTPNSGSGAYQIAFNSSLTAPPIVVKLTADVWANNTSGSIQWFKFIATAETNYIHVRFSTLSSMYVQLYDSNGVTVGDQTALGGSIKYTSRSSLTIGEMYYIKVTLNFGGGDSYQITFNTSATAPLPTNVTSLSAKVWADGSIPTSSGEQWFKFTATATLQYIHVSFSTLSNLNVQVYNSSGNTVGSQSHLEYNSNKYTSISRSSLTIGQVYYIQITPYSGSGNYQITFSSSSDTPGNEMSNAIQLSAGVWVDGYIPNLGGEQWFKFTATNNTQYIHINFTASTLSVLMYDSGNNLLFANAKPFQGKDEDQYLSQSLTSGQEYYIMVKRSNANDYLTSVSYKITFNASATEPPIITNATSLSSSVWADGNLPSLNSEQWFKFTATAETQYIHVWFGTLNRMWIQLYDSGGNKVGNRTELYSRTYTNQTLTVGQDYYINVTPYSSSYSGTYKIAFNTSSTAPSTGAEANPIPLTADTWSDGNITSTTSGNAIWYSFNVTGGKTYYVWWNDGYNGNSAKTLDVKVSAYFNGSSTAINDFSGVDAAWNSPKSFTANSTGTVKLKVEPYNSSSSGTFAIVYSISNTRP